MDTPEALRERRLVLNYMKDRLDAVSSEPSVRSEIESLAAEIQQGKHLQSKTSVRVQLTNAKEQFLRLWGLAGRSSFYLKKPWLDLQPSLDRAASERDLKLALESMRALALRQGVSKSDVDHLERVW